MSAFIEIQKILNTLCKEYPDDERSKIITAFTTEIVSLYTNFKHCLDNVWLDKFCQISHTQERLFELIILKFLGESVNFTIQKYKGKKEEPDFMLEYDLNKFLLEATSVGMPTDEMSEFQKAYKIWDQKKALSSSDYSIEKMVSEYKSRLTQAICEKNKYKKLVEELKVGFILFISLGKIPFWVSPDSFHLIHALLGCGNFNYFLKPGTNQCVNMSYQSQENFNLFKENNRKIELSNQNLLDKENKWISAIILSPTDPFLLLNCAETFNIASWKEKPKNDFIVIYNPYANIPLKKQILPVATEISYDLEENKIMQSGHEAFPDYYSIFSN